MCNEKCREMSIEQGGCIKNIKSKLYVMKRYIKKGVYLFRETVHKRIRQANYVLNIEKFPFKNFITNKVFIIKKLLINYNFFLVNTHLMLKTIKFNLLREINFIIFRLLVSDNKSIIFERRCYWGFYSCNRCNLNLWI